MALYIKDGIGRCLSSGFASRYFTTMSRIHPTPILARDADDVCFYEPVYDVFNRASIFTDMTEVGLIIARNWQSLPVMVLPKALTIDAIKPTKGGNT